MTRPWWDSRRRAHLEELGITVFEPRERQADIRASDLLVICAPRYREEIVGWAARATRVSHCCEE